MKLQVNIDKLPELITVLCWGLVLLSLLRLCIVSAIAVIMEMILREIVL